MPKRNESSAIKAVFPLNDNELVVLFKAPLAGDQTQNLKLTSAAGLKIKAVSLDLKNRSRLVVKTSDMGSEAIVIDKLSARGLILENTKRQISAISPPFVHGIRNPSQLKVPHLNQVFPYASTLVGVHVSVACCTGCNGGVHDRDLVVLNHHVGGPWTGIWVRTAKTIDAPYPRWQKVLCAGGVMTEFNGSTTVSDEGWMEIHKLLEEPHHAPPALPLETAEISSYNKKAIFLKGLDASWVQFEGINILSAKTISPETKASKSRLLTRNEVTFADASGGHATAYLYQSSGLKVGEGQTVRQLRGFVHAERPGQYVLLSDKEEDIVI